MKLDIQSALSWFKGPSSAATRLPEKDAQVITRIVQAFKDRTKKDIQKWRLAVQTAESIVRPRRRLLIDIYRDIMIDNHLTSVTTTRNLKVKGSRFKVVNAQTREEDEEKTRLLRKIWFYNYLDHVLDSRYYGFSLVQFGELLNGEFQKVELVPREHVVPNHYQVLLHLTDSTGIDFREAPFSNWLIGIGERQDLGLLYKAAPQAIIKRNAQSAWSEYSEIFGMPMRTATTTSRDQKEIDRVEAMLEQMGSAAYAVFPEGTTLDIKESKGTDAYMVYQKQMEYCDQQMSKLIFGQTSTADASAGKFKADVHDEISDDYTEDDMTFVQYHVNEVLFPFLALHGYGFEGMELVWDDEQELPAEEKIKIDEAISRMGYRPKKKYLEETYNIELEEVEQPDPTKPQPGQKKQADPDKEETENVGVRLAEINALYEDV